MKSLYWKEIHFTQFILRTTSCLRPFKKRCCSYSNEITSIKYQFAGGSPRVLLCNLPRVTLCHYDSYNIKSTGRWGWFILRFKRSIRSWCSFNISWGFSWIFAVNFIECLGIMFDEECLKYCFFWNYGSRTARVVFISQCYLQPAWYSVASSTTLISTIRG